MGSLCTSPPGLALSLHSGSAHTRTQELRRIPCSGIPYVFGAVRLTHAAPWSDADRGVSALMMSYWTQFAWWRPFDEANDAYLTLGDHNQTRAVRTGSRPC
jgi:hypothetical protein